MKKREAGAEKPVRARPVKTLAAAPASVSTSISTSAKITSPTAGPNPTPIQAVDPVPAPAQPLLPFQPLRSTEPLVVRHLHFRNAAPGWIARRHAHRIPQFYWCSFGTVDVEINGTTYHLRATDSILVTPDAIREVRVPQRAAGYLVTMFEAAAALGIDAAYDRVLPLPGDARDDAHALVAEVRRPGGADSRMLVAALVTRILVGLARSARAPRQGHVPSPLNAESQADLVAQVEAFLNRNLPHGLRRADVAAAVNLSEPHLARVFKAATGTSIMDRLLALRIEQAQVLLLESTMSVTQIAHAVGITSFSYFSKAFKDAAGMTPSDYRKAGGRTFG